MTHGALVEPGADGRRAPRAGSDRAGTALTDDDGVVLEVDPAYCALVAGRPRDLLGRRLHEVVRVDGGLFDLPAAVARLLAAGAGAPPLSAEGVVHRLDGTSFAARSSLSLSGAAAGRPVVVARLAPAGDGAEPARALPAGAGRDALTGLPGRPALLAALTALLGADGPGAPAPLAVVHCDVDRLAVVNDALGRGAGDELLAVVARALPERLRAGDLVARVAPDEFVAVLGAVADPATALRAARRLAAPLVVPLAGRDVTTTLRAGVALARPDAGGAGPEEAARAAEALLRDASSALGEAGRAGRGAVRLHCPAARERALRSLDAEEDLRRGLRRGELEVHYQPVVDLREQRRVGFEALARWRHPERGLLLPADFLPAAEESGLDAVVDAVVLTAALDFLQRRPGVHVAVNVSARRLDGTWAATVTEGLARRGVAPQRLVVELLETALLADDPVPVAELRALSARGVPVFIDDFGTGWAALSYLRRLPVDGVKLDRSFVADLPGDRDCARIADAVAALAAGLSLQALAEGVETAAQARLLAERGWRYAQGWHFGRAEPEEHWYPAQGVRATDAPARPGCPSREPA
ncbi:putative bifunctional diguanylate cyclase/phosphodiesterase [Kineococcus terrestris]|uniref:putative bifunctional diguanylate cyclase/phosphodiesterase n=1 Tax=Kineococcus terrestris TaxID=2044856 RepID=UPI0034DB5336